MTYIFLTPEIGSMGGSQMYVCNKSIYLRSLGWDVKICYFTKSDVFIKRMHDFETYYFPELAWGVQFYLPCRVKKIIKDIVISLGLDDNNIIVESCLFHLAFWGEMLASKLKAKHIIDFLEEGIPDYSPRVARFIEYKLFRWECMNASEASLKRIFKNYYKPEYKKYEFVMDFYCSNVSYDLDNTTDTYNNILDTFNREKQTDRTILSIGRLDKPYIYEMVNQILLFSRNHKNLSISLIFIGGSPDGKVEKDIKKITSEVSNIKLHLFGYVYPIPSQIVKFANIAIASSNSVLVSYNLGIPTIAVDANDYYALGLYGEDTYNKVFRKDEKKIPISYYLEKVLINNDYKSPSSVIAEKSEQELLDEHFKDQIYFIERTNNDGSYYNVSSIIPFVRNIRGLLVRFVVFLKKL
ncbi:MAG: hypothetical protein IKJ81_08190 [Bacteroidales bacterium]|nr:hypothetical protein [Bacteroidales bacterium]